MKETGLSVQDPFLVSGLRACEGRCPVAVFQASQSYLLRNTTCCGSRASERNRETNTKAATSSDCVFACCASRFLQGAGHRSAVSERARKLPVLLLTESRCAFSSGLSQLEFAAPIVVGNLSVGIPEQAQNAKTAISITKFRGKETMLCEKTSNPSVRLHVC